MENQKSIDEEGKVACSQDKPFFNGKECISCESGTYFNADTKACSSCPEGSTFDGEKKKCVNDESNFLTNPETS